MVRVGGSVVVVVGVGTQTDERIDANNEWTIGTDQCQR